ncbi:MAG: isocitrate lyase/phosphoenolpyruvate mutase family protein [Lysobacterales bacterium]
MNHASGIDQANAFRAMHDRTRVLVLPNAWDAGSARLFEQLGFAAIATTSAGVAWSLGYADGERAPLAEVVAATARIVRTVALPVSVDIEAGYGDTAAQVADSVRAIIGAGAVGINLEDGVHHGMLRDAVDAARRIEAARHAAVGAGVPIVINARTDTYLLDVGASPAERFDDTVQRARNYLAAGADCIYPIGVADRATIAALVEAIDASVNIGARPGVPDLADLARLGVARVSTATRLATVALSAARDAAAALLASGRFDGLVATLGHADAQHLFARD